MGHLIKLAASKWIPGLITQIIIDKPISRNAYEVKLQAELISDF